MNHSRRELCFILPAMLVAGSKAGAAEALPSKVYPFNSLPVQKSGGNTFRPIFEGVTHEGYYLELHESELAPNAMPHPPHRHPHEEVFLVREGTLEITINGVSSRFGPGSVAYVASNAWHGVRNVGDADALYFVLEIGTPGHEVTEKS